MFTSIKPINLYYFIYFLFGISIISVVIVWNSNLHKNPKFTTLLSLLTALTIFFSSFAIIIQLYTFHAEQLDAEVKIYDKMFTKLFEDSISFFEKNPKMNYLYNEIFKPLNYTYKPPVKRYYSEEQQIVRVILQDLSALVYYLENDSAANQADSYTIERKLDGFIGEALSSPIFKENYIHIKPTILSVNLKNYIQRKFNI